MRIAVANQHQRVVGGVERYLDVILPALAHAGHDIALLSECDIPADRARVRVPDSASGWCIAELGDQHALAALRNWRADLIFVHQLSSPALEKALIEVAPAVRFAHGYAGLCISGRKTFVVPTMRPCARRFGWACLAAYYPRRCGGLSPLTMWRDFRTNSAQLALAQRYRATVVASEHMRREHIKHGLPPQSVHKIALPIESSDLHRADVRCSDGASAARLLFVGRAEQLKGGQIALDALPDVARRLDRTIKMTFAGEGPALDDWRRRAARIRRRDPRIAVEFAGWLGNRDLVQLAANSDLLIVPSLWPEPFGIIGPEMGLARLPAAAFAVGGIPEWLADGVNGFLAPADPPTAAGLADAIVRCLGDRAVHVRLRDGAERIAREFSLADHIARLTNLFARVTGETAAAEAPIRQHLAG